MQQKKLKLKFQAYQEPDTKKRTGYIYNKMKKQVLNRCLLNEAVIIKFKGRFRRNSLATRPLIAP
jgi:hypothetical protein